MIPARSKARAVASPAAPAPMTATLSKGVDADTDTDTDAPLCDMMDDLFLLDVLCWEFKALTPVTPDSTERRQAKMKRDVARCGSSSGRDLNALFPLLLHLSIIFLSYGDFLDVGFRVPVHSLFRGEVRSHFLVPRSFLYFSFPKIFIYFTYWKRAIEPI